MQNDFFRRYEFEYIHSNMYIALVPESEEALMIDSHPSEDAYRYLVSNHIKKLIILLTHEHFDHTCGINFFRENFASTLICQKNCAEAIANKKNNRSLSVAMIMNDTAHAKELKDFFKRIGSYSCQADIVFEEEYLFEWNGHQIRLCHGPGHSRGSACIWVDDEFLFTGDSLIPDETVITRFPGGDRDMYDNKTLPCLLKADKDIRVMPGHGLPRRMSQLAYRGEHFWQCVDEGGKGNVGFKTVR